MLSEQAKTVFVTMQGHETWQVRLDHRSGRTFDLGETAPNHPLSNVAVGIFEELVTYGLIQQIYRQTTLGGRFTLLTYRIQH